MERARNTRSRLLISMVIFLSVVVFSQERSSADAMISSPISSKERGYGEVMENFYVGAGFFAGYSKLEDDAGNALDLEISQRYGVVGYRFSPWTDAYIRVGSAETDIDGLGLQGSGELFATLGLNSKWYESSSYSIWFSIQGTWYDKKEFASVSGAQLIELDSIEAAVAPIALDYKIPLASRPNLLTVYGGLLARYTWADVNITNVSTGGQFDTSLKNESNFGGFAGLHIVPLDGLNIDIETQYIDRFSFGVSLVYAFPADL